MKRLIGTVAALAMLIWKRPMARAELIGELSRDRVWGITSDNATVGEVLENFPQQGIVMAPQIKPLRAAFVRIVPGSGRLIALARSAQ